MHSAKTWWRDLGGLLAAAVIAVLAFAPALDALICGGEEPTVNAPAAIAEAQAPVAKDQVADLGEHHGAVSGHADGGVCPHGHCHHGGVAQPAPQSPRFALLSVAARLPIPLSAVPVSDPHYSLDRPPRA